MGDQGREYYNEEAGTRRTQKQRDGGKWDKMDVSGMTIDKVSMLTYSHESDSRKQQYYGIRVFDKYSDRCKEIDFTNKHSDPREKIDVSKAIWETQYILEDEQLIGFHS